jgi:hypothetical protein
LNLRRAAAEGAQPSRKVGHNLPGGKAELRAAKLAQKRASRATAGDSAFDAEAMRDALIRAFSTDGELARFETVALSRYARDVARKIGATLGFTAVEMGTGGRNEKRRLVLTRRRGASDGEDGRDGDADADGDGEEAPSDCDGIDADDDDGEDGYDDDASSDGASDKSDGSDGGGEATSSLHPDAVAAASAVCDRHSSVAAGDGVRAVASALRALRRRRQQERVSARAGAAPRGKSRGQVWEKPGAAEPEDEPAAAAPGAGAQEAKFIGFVAEGAEEDCSAGAAEEPQLRPPEEGAAAAALARALERAHLSSASQPSPDAPAPADWEAHTRGIGSKLLAKWGFSGGALGAAGRPHAASSAQQPALMEQVVKRDKAGLGAAR